MPARRTSWPPIFCAIARERTALLLDLPATSSWVLRRIARMNPTVLIPLAPDMNSVLTLQSVNQFLQSIQDADGHPLSPYFILNQFDPTLPLHIDVREVLRQQLGDRLLPFVIHRAPAISEALAEGMTILDYAPESVAAQDYLNVATWVRQLTALGACWPPQCTMERTMIESPSNRLLGGSLSRAMVYC